MSGRGFWATATLALVVAAFGGICLGATPLDVSTVWSALRHEGDPTAIAIVWTLRIPRVILAALIGAGLSVAGSAMQGVLRNPLAEPYLLGVSGGAAVGAVIATAAGGAWAIGILPLAAFAGAVAAVILVLIVARSTGREADPRVMLMAGVIVGAFANAVIMVLLAGAQPNTVRNALWWMMGSAAGADWAGIRWLSIALLVGGGALFAWAREIDVLALGDEAAAALGAGVESASRRIFAVSAFVAAATVAAAGLVGFVGLVVPHMVRAAGVRYHRGILPGAALAGATLVVVADAIARTAIPPAELPLGAVTALIGVPFFLLQLRRMRS